MLSIVETNDGSHTLFNAQLQAHYHSVYGAIQESKHVFINEGLIAIAEGVSTINILEFGFGTGLNVYLSYLFGLKLDLVLNYTSIENFPIPTEIFSKLNYPTLLEDGDATTFHKFHLQEWNTTENYSSGFKLTKTLQHFQNLNTEFKYDLIYYDAFAPSHQSDLWSQEMMKSIYNIMNHKGIMTTFCAKGSVKRALLAAGFVVEKRPGPPGKREMIRAWKK